MIDLSCDYNMGCAPEILCALENANGERHATYGDDAYSVSAREKIRRAVGLPSAEVFFLIGGTQTNATVLTALLAPYEGVLSAPSGHIAVHEAGAVEAGGHKVLEIPCDAFGRVTPEGLRTWLGAFYADPTSAHMVQPGVVYLSHPTEYGGLYTAQMLRQIREICDDHGLRLFVDGARLAYALAADGADVTLPLLGELCDAFYIGGTKCGALLGEAVVFRRPQPGFFTLQKQRGAVPAKGFLVGLQFEILFTDGLYERLGQNGINCAGQLRTGLRELGISFMPESPSNQLFPVLNADQLRSLDGMVGYEIWSRLDDGRAVIRLCTSWKTTSEDVSAVLRALAL